MTDRYWSLPDVITGFVAAMRERPLVISEGIQVEEFWPGEELQQEKSIWVDEGRGTDEVAGMRQGPIRNNEVYDLYVVCDAFAEGGDGAAAMAALKPLVGEVMAELAEKKRVETPDNKVLAARVAGWRYRQYAWRNGRGAACRVNLKLSGRR